ncbi:MAG: PAS domain S-box protein [Sphingobacteriales bacterium]|nr:PAS domain S-box protein [Sphingobacteriales bacterium]
MWKDIRRIIEETAVPREKFISLINEEGMILSANSRMKRSFHLAHPRATARSMFELLHPVNQPVFKDGLLLSAKKGKAISLEASLKNGFYHPMKWHVSPLRSKGEQRTYLCVGHHLLDEDRSRLLRQLGSGNNQLIFESLDTGVLFQDTRGELIAVNQKAAEIFNTTLERLYQLRNVAGQWNHSWQIHQENGAPVQFDKTPFMKALETGKGQSEILVVGLKNGELRWLQFSSQPVFTENSQAASAVVTKITDLTPEKEQLRDLKERKAVLKSFMKLTPNLAWVVNEKASLLFASKYFYEFFGINEATAANQSLLKLVPSPVAEAMYKKHLQVLETGKPTDVIQTIKWADGSEYIFHIDIFPIEGVPGKKILGGYAVNLTDKYETEKKLRETNERLLLLSRATSDSIWEWDMQTGHIFRNDALMDMIGYHTDVPRGLSWWLRRIHPEDRNRVGDAVKQSTEEGSQSWQQEYRFKCADGTYKYMRDKGYIVYENGLPVKMIGSIQDISDIKELEGRLIEERLMRQKEVSEKVIQAQEKERTQIGHELHDNVNQILSSARLFFEMISAGNKEQSLYQSKGLEYISMAVEEIRKLSRELVAPRLRENSLVPCIDQLIGDTRMASGLLISFTHDSDADQLTDGKKVTLFRILQEQLKNILKHSGADRVEIRLEQKEEWIRLTVKDNGTGFDANQTFRGIGLNNIYERARFYDGTVDIQTAPGKGCTLTVQIAAS